MAMHAIETTLSSSCVHFKYHMTHFMGLLIFFLKQ